ncbi:right-handed parallel beta-helix repeat-containing protein [Aureimonas pseudogalii]|uniref:Parallel beta-helix repeat protein n=1 Tax=Aureimonas pseudogalii TaxID=1744844 RepID=A0A7W6EH19_9HYPH|nr:right-handed parallel beta-helix repeat-containing protein [Aureimonas pseudogalii]MBB3997904.1 parallel beta-helix repeat protein [Aureimonas pseudogalii]
MPNPQIVSNDAELLSALKHANGGETILLEGGSRYSLDLKHVSFASNVTVKSLSSNDQAVFTDVKLDHVANLRLDGVTFDSHGDKRPDWQPDLFVEDSRNISVVNSTMKGDASAFNNGKVHVATDGVRVSGTNGFTFENNEVSNYNFGIKVTVSDNVTIAGNDVHHMQADGMQFADVDKIVVDGNQIHDFLGSLFSINHNDMIQFFTSHTTSASDGITIRNNVLDSGDGHWTQGIFMGNELGIAYRGVLIENNTVFNNSFHGITVGEADGVVIRNNSVLLNEETPRTEFRNDNIYISIKPGSRDVVVENNIAGKLDIHSPASVHDNLTVDYRNPNAQNYYAKVLDLAGQTDDSHVAGIKLSSQSDLVRELLGAGPLGSSLTRQGSGPSEPPATTPTKPEPTNPVQTGTGGNDRLFGTGGDDAVRAGAGHDLVDGGAGDDKLYGDAGSDHLRGGNGDDSLFGGDGADMLWGGAGNDRLDGGAGRDNYYGGDGLDVFVLVKGEIADDRIHGYEPGRDRIVLSGFGDDASVSLAGRGVYAVHEGQDTAQFRVVGYSGETDGWLVG